MARIAVGGFQHETNTFAPLTASWADFERADAWPPFVRGPELIESRRRVQHPDRRRREDIAGARSRAGALVLVFGAALLLCRRGGLREGRRLDRRGSAGARTCRCGLSRSPRSDGRRALRGW